jgi:hypothetical protein
MFFFNHKNMFGHFEVLIEIIFYLVILRTHRFDIFKNIYKMKSKCLVINRYYIFYFRIKLLILMCNKK